jgi:hypothetical protein
MDIKGEVMRRTGLDAATVDKIFNALGEIVSERYPQFAGLLGPALGINVTSPGPGAGSAGTGGTGGAGAQGMPDFGSIFGSGGTGGTGTGGSGSPQGGSQS